MTFEVQGIARLLLARWFLGSSATALADFPPKLVAELHPDFEKIGPFEAAAFSLLALLPNLGSLSAPLDSLHYWPSRAAS